MKQQAVFSDFIYQVFSLIIALIFVHAFYVAVVRPNADAILAQQAVMQEQNPEFVQETSLYVVLKDFEQEAEIILMFWALAIIALKLKRNRDEARLLDRRLLNIADGMSKKLSTTADFRRLYLRTAKQRTEDWGTGSLTGRGMINMSQWEPASRRLLTLPRKKVAMVERPRLPATIRSAPSVRALCNAECAASPRPSVKLMRRLSRPSLATLRRMRAMTPASSLARDSRMTASGTSASRSIASRDELMA